MTLTLSPETRLSVSPDAIMSDVDGEIVLICVTSGRYFGLDGVGSEIWRRLQSPISIADLTAALQAHFKGDGATIERETMDFVAKLVDRNLVTSA
ncbi:PqqD family peptide modification chaperone [Sphingomonas sp. AOB5]|uniref:PqqD family peptide modification chaperone n=1 Tax=Sphingomonas sp. AOB5 TaxID=3034017 RepID=UPI0023F7F933|nr:PqqD family peptide modification chaperone [Sphingomonas sp. AOB5]MDF7776834.1 PqqD family peptide modification chaperone [Sphingomonas sp. AOB5]